MESECPLESVCLDGCRRPREPIDCAELDAELELLHAGALPVGTTTIALLSAELPGTEMVVGHGTRVSALRYLGQDELLETDTLELGSAAILDLVGRHVPLPASSSGPAIGVADEAGGHLLTLTAQLELELGGSFASECEPVQAHLARTDLGELQDLVLHTRCGSSDHFETFYDALVDLPSATAALDGEWSRVQLHDDTRECESRWFGFHQEQDGVAVLVSTWLAEVEIGGTTWSRATVGYREQVEGSWLVATRRFSAQPVDPSSGYYLYVGHYGTDLYRTSGRPLDMSARGEHAIRVGAHELDVFKLVDGGGACRQTITTSAPIADLDLMHPGPEDPGVELAIVLEDATLLLYGNP